MGTLIAQCVQAAGAVHHYQRTPAGARPAHAPLGKLPGRPKIGDHIARC